MAPKGSVLVAMSGGVDSSVAACLLHEQGYEVVGSHMRLAHLDGVEHGCCGPSARRDAEEVARIAGFSFEISDMTLEFDEAVIDDFIAEHAAGRTPNPCSRCNGEIKFGAFLRRADELGVGRERSDHEALTAEEGRERLRAGMWLLIREASMARNLEALLPLVLEYGPDRIAFCTDDRDPDDIADNGHINGMVRDAVAFGVTPEDALLMASFHPAQWHGLGHLGAVAAGYQADLLLLPDLESFAPEVVLKRGRPIEDVPPVPVPEWVRQTVRVQPVSAADFEIPSDGATIRAIGLIEDQVVTESLERVPVVVDGLAVSDADAGLAKIAVVERHLATGRIGLGFVAGSGLRRGALASSVAHDAHNLVVVGMSDDDLAFAVTHLARIGGGIVVVEDGRVLAECPLPVAGLLSDAPLADVIEQSRATNEAAAALGWTGATPFLTLAFLALSVIPSLKITDRGLVDVDRFEIVPLEVRA